jgi:enoyl-CoA hydratase/carnithine racemase
VVAPEQLIDSALELAGQIAANAPLAIQTTRTLTRRAVETDPSKGWGTPAELGVVFGSEDAMEGAMAFMEKRSPNWKSR